MKNLMLFLTLSLTIFSCKKEAGYSCDEKIDSYAKNMQVVNQNISRDSLAKFGIDTQLAVFRSLTPTNKKRIFNEKIDLLLATETLTQAEQNHLNNARNAYTSNIYSATGSSADTIGDAWIVKAKVTLGWDDEKIYFYVGSVMTMAEYFQLATPLEASSSNSCRCSTTSSGSFSCGFVGSCKNYGCETTQSGCGWFWRKPCNGRCWP